VNRISDLFVFLSTDLRCTHKARIAIGYYFFSRFGRLKILGLKLTYDQGSSNHSLLILREIFLNQIYSFTKTTDLKLKTKQGVIIDIGANIGIATAYFKKTYPDTKLVAIEASPTNYLNLIKNIEVNKFQNIETINCFISNSNAVIKFYHNIYKPGGSFGEGFKPKGYNNFEEFNVNTRKISEIIRPYKNIVIKIDVEGAEYKILEDLASSENIDEVIEIIVEVSTSNLEQYNNLNVVLNRFFDLGFEPRILSDYTIKSLRDKSKQGHLQLSLVRSF
jgi:FkbM family methyltransferase